MKFHREVIDVMEAKRRIALHMKEGPVERISLAQSFGRYLAEEIIADSPIPHFSRSGMDGFAVRAEDTAQALSQSVTLEVIESIPCGSVPMKQVMPGQASRIMTGAVVPDGANAVIPFEWTKSQGQTQSNHVIIEKPVRVGDNITTVGSEIQTGTHLLSKGTKIGAGEAAVLATYGKHMVQVYKQPVVAIIATGSELLNVSDPLEPGKIRNSNSSMLAALVQDAGGIAQCYDPLSDDVELLKKVLKEAFSTADLLITIGGVSVGDYDILTEWFTQWEGELLFNKLSMRPGSPTSVGVWREKPLFALSGNPGACFVGFELFVRPYMRKWQGQDSIHRPEIQAHLDGEIPAPGSYQRFVRAAQFVQDGKVWVKPVGVDKSSVMISIKDTNALIIVPGGSQGYQKGDLVSVVDLR